MTMPRTKAPVKVIERAVHLACRAPSYHNSQPWLWEFGDDELRLYVDADRLVSTDGSGRQALISCGAALDHLRVALAAEGFRANVDYYPNPNNHRHVASVTISAISYITEAHRRRAEAIWMRHTDRLPLAAPPDWPSFERSMRAAVTDQPSMVDVLTDLDRRDLEEASMLSESLRMYDSAYHQEMHWWTAPFEVSDGIPHDALVSAAESDRVAIGRTFPVTHHRERRLEVPEDRSTVVVISAADDTRRDVLGCGETLSAILLEATLAGLATGILSHVTEVPASRDIVAELTGRSYPQVLVRIGLAPALEDAPVRTPRRPLSDVLHYTTRPS
jgi:hypothetical protein